MATFGNVRTVVTSVTFNVTGTPSPVASGQLPLWCVHPGCGLHATMFTFMSGFVHAGCGALHVTNGWWTLNNETWEFRGNNFSYKIT